MLAVSVVEVAVICDLIAVVKYTLRMCDGFWTFVQFGYSGDVFIEVGFWNDRLRPDGYY